MRFLSRDSILYDFVTEFMPFMAGLILGLFILGMAIWAAVYTAFDPTTCRTRGAKMGVEVSWAFWEGCMANLKGQWLPWGDVVAVERDGKIVFVPRPQQVIKVEK